ncbi:hypothetical protein [Cellvibrio polysaccharolyticus]|uniref:Uncharacterized protein n=1 Tax=Cellvibrio polysaccharolyticus TaxID=2082724 RepID=A0A928YUB0_9GAMM|nr:hypothetical protein [Cellvibrio polysaccharolyticus]MBE8715918.1 hypothetical protein [Cellvibrio polysaccharolyticus]
MEMPRRATKPLLLTLLAALSFAAQVEAQSDDCQLVSTASVQQTLGLGAPKHSQANSYGSCNWLFPESGLFKTQVFKLSSTAEAGELYQGYLRETLAEAETTPLGEPLGQKSIRGVKDQHSHRVASVVILQDDQVIVSDYHDDPAKFDGQTLNKLESLAAQVFANRGGIDQDFGGCDWFPPAQTELLLGKNATIQRLADQHCLAYTNDGGSLTLSTTPSMNADAFAVMQTSYNSNCTTAALRELGDNAFAYFDCKSANPVVIVEMLNKATHGNLAYAPPGGRAANSGDVEALKPLLRHISSKL